MKICKALIVLAAFLLVAMGMQPAAQATLSIPDGGNYSTYMDQVSFYLFDLDNSGDATLNANTITFPLPANGHTPSLEYSINGSPWNEFTGPLSFNYIDYGNSDLAQISFRLNSNQIVSAGNVTFQTYDLDNSTTVGEDLFQALFVTWGTNNQSCLTFSSADDPVGPHTPIPTTALLLFSGLIGLIGFRRRMNHQ